MALTCDPNELALAAKCFQCLDDKSQKAIELYLMALIAGVSPDPEALQSAAKGFKGIGKGEWQAMMVYLTCLVAGGISYSQCLELSGAVSPVGSQTPQFIGQLYHNTTDDTYWRSTGLTNADWVQISGGGGTCQFVWGPHTTELDFVDFSQTEGINSTFLFPTLIAVDDFVRITSSPVLQSIQFPALTTISNSGRFELNTVLTDLQLDALVSVGGDLEIYGCGVLPSLDLSSLTTVAKSLLLYNCPLLSSINLGDLVSVGNVFDISGCSSLTVLDISNLTTIISDFYTAADTNLTTILCGSWVPTDGTSPDFSGCALSAVTVELLLRRFVLAGVTTCTIDLSGGTNAGVASLNAQGQADVVTLGAQLTINP